MTPSPAHTSKPALKWLLRRARSARFWIVLTIGLGFGSGILLIVQASLIARIVHGAFMEHRPRSELADAFLLFALVVGGRAVMAWARERAGFQAGAIVRREVRLDLLAHLNAAGPALTRRQPAGALTSTVLEHVEALHNFFARYLPQLALAVLIPLSIVVVIFPISWTAGVILAATAPLIPLFMVLIGMGAESVSQRQFQTLSRMSAHFLDILQGLPTLKIFHRSQKAAKHVSNVSREYRHRTMRVLRIAFLSSAVLEFFSSISIALVAVYLGTYFLGYINFGTYGNPLTLGAGLFILVLAPDFYLPLRELGTHYHARAEAAGAAEEILKVLQDAAALKTDDTGASGRIGPLAEIKFDDVGFAFEDHSQELLQKISFTVRSGERVILTGPSGGGKTTLLNLLMGFFRPSAGAIRVNDRPLETLSLQHWRSLLAWVGQHPVLFHGTLRDNIRLGRPQADEAAVSAAAEAALVLEFADRMPRSLDTAVGEKGRRLSRGQAQRVALARAFLSEAPLLLLDEPTAGLDSTNERLVAEAIDRVGRGRTVIMVTHRLTHIQNARRVLTMVDGRIVEDGSYRDLMAARGPLSNLLQPPKEASRHA
jgi:ATP-binding cassette subfamily C protein CydD